MTTENRCDNDEENQQSWDMDILLTELGIGRFQIRIFFLIGLLLMFANVSTINYTLTAADLDYRCYVPECDRAGSSDYLPKWLINAVPFNSDDEPNKCLRYQPSNRTIKSFADCSKRSLFSSKEETCDRWVFATEENTIAREFRIMCEDRRWQLTLVGTANTVGHYIGNCLFGLVSDRHGRKFVVILCSVMSSTFGLVRSQSTGYKMFISFEFLDAFFSAGIYGAAFMLGLEFMSPKLRPLTTSIMGTFYPFGAIAMGVVAWWVQDWRKFLIICYAPGLLFALYYWLIPESVRWLHAKGKHEEAMEIITNIENTNKRPLLKQTSSKIKSTNQNAFFEAPPIGYWIALKLALKCKRLLIRLLACSYCWFTFTLVYYGLTINSVELVGNKFLNFILINLVEVPAFLFCGFIMAKYPRKPTQISTLLLSAIGCIGCQLVPADQWKLQITLFLLSKFMITTAFLIFYAYAAEMYPTQLRLSLFSLSCSIGRVGMVLAPQTVLLKQYVGKQAPVLLFSVTSLIAAILTTIFPETFSKRLPDTLDQVTNDK